MNTETDAQDSSTPKGETQKSSKKPKKLPPSQPIPVGNTFIYQATRFFVGAHFRLGGGRCFGRENIPLEGRFILAPNHASYIDPPLISTLSPRRPHVIAKKELFEKWILNVYFRGLGAFPIARGKADRKAIRRAIEVLESEAPLMIFPEGTRTRDGNLGKAEIGLGMIAHATKSPIIPVYIKGSGQACSPINPKFAFVKMEVHYGKPLPLEEEYSRRGDRTTIAAIGDKTMQAIADLRDAAG